MYPRLGTPALEGTVFVSLTCGVSTQSGDKRETTVEATLSAARQSRPFLSTHKQKVSSDVFGK